MWISLGIRGMLCSLLGALGCGVSPELFGRVLPAPRVGTFACGSCVLLVRVRSGCMRFRYVYN